MTYKCGLNYYEVRAGKCPHGGETVGYNGILDCKECNKKDEYPEESSMTDDKLKAGEVDSRPMQGQRRVNTVPDSPHGIEAGRPLSTIPDWIVEYDKKNFQSSAGKAIRHLIEVSRNTGLLLDDTIHRNVALQSELTALQAENERLKRKYENALENDSDYQDRLDEIKALQSKIDRVMGELEPLVREENAKYFTTDELSVFNRILDLLK